MESGQVEMKGTAQSFLVYHQLLLWVISLPNPKWPGHLWYATFIVLFLGLLTSSQTLVQRGLFLVIWIGINVTLPMATGLALFPQLSSCPRCPLLSFLSRSYFQRSCNALTSSRKPSLAYWGSHYLNCPSWYHTRKDPLTYQLHASGPLSYSLKNTHRILMVPWPSKARKPWNQTHNLLFPLTPKLQSRQEVKWCTMKSNKYQGDHQC